VDDNGRLRLWNLDSGTVAHELPGHDAQTRDILPGLPAGDLGFPPPPDELLAAVRTNAVNAIALARSEPVAVSGGDDATVRLWDIPSGDCLETFRGHPVPVNDVAINHEGLFLSAAGDNTLRVSDPLAGCLRVLSGHGGAVHAVAVAPDGTTVVSGASGIGEVPYADHSVRMWDVESGACLRILKGHGHWVNGVAVAPDARSAVSCSTDGTIRIWDLSHGAELRAISPSAGHVERIALSPDGRTIAAATQRGGTILHDAATGNRLRTLNGHRGRVNGVAFDSDGSTLVTAGEDGTVRVWNVADGECLAIYPAHSPVRSVSSIRADARFACGTADGRVHFLTLRNRASGTPVITAARRFRIATDSSVRRGDDSPLFEDGAKIPGAMDDAPTFDCPWCGDTFGVGASTMETIDDWRTLLPDDAPSLELAHLADAFADDGLKTSCPGCGKQLRFNPFICARAEIEIVDWRNDPALRGRFNPQFPDDIEVLVHDGHPGFTGRSPERAWVRIHGRHGVAWTGTLLNQPYHLQSIAKGGDVLFIAPSSGKDLVQVTPKYLEERREWTVGSCSKCGISETFCPPSELLEHTNTPPHARSQVRRLTAPCPMCDGSQVLTRR
jgi:WD40 repeat protein